MKYIEGDKWIRIQTSYACGVVAMRNGIVVDAAPIFKKWAVGLTEEELRRRKNIEILNV